jgi:hypothetical protein
MESPKSSRLVCWLRALEGRADAWAARKLTPEELAEAQEADRRLKRNFWPLLGLFLGVSAVVGLLLYAIKPRFGLVEALVISTLLCFAMLMCFVFAFYGWRKLTGPQGWRKMLAIAVLATIGAVVGATVAALTSGKPLPTDAQSVGRMLAVGRTRSSMAWRRAAAVGWRCTPPAARAGCG